MYIYILTFCLAYILTFCLAYTLTVLSGIYSDILSGILSGFCSGPVPSCVRSSRFFWLGPVPTVTTSWSCTFVQI